MREYTTLSSGQSYWRVKLSTGRTLCELDTITDIRSARTRHAEWLEDLCGSDDLSKVIEVTLCTPHGEASIDVPRPRGVFQLSCGIVALFDHQRTKTAQIIGVLDGDNGECIAAIWDVLEQQIYTDFHTNVLDFAAWHDGIAPIGRLNIEALGLVL
jgi:hypothetical protein